MDKKQKTMFISILVILILIVLLIGFTFAKYISTYDGNGRLRVAKWSFKVNGWSSEETKQLSLLDTVRHVDLAEGRIAPGFTGELDLEIDAKNSEVDVQYSIQAEETGHKPDNLKFQAIINQDHYTEFYPTLKELADNELNGVIKRNAVQKALPIKIRCIWPFMTGDTEEEVEKENIEDTAVGKGAYAGMINTYDYTFSLKVVGTQARVEKN